MEQKQINLPALLVEAEKQFGQAVDSANTIAIFQNASAAFTAVRVVKSLRDCLTKDVMEEVFMPLMNTKIGFLTDRNGRANWEGKVKPIYALDVVRDAIIDAVSYGLLPTGNQFNIIADKMYPTKEGYSALLKKLGVKYWITIGLDKGTNEKFAEIQVKIDYEYNGEKKSILVNTTVKKDVHSTPDALKGKAERRAKKQLYEYLTGCDLGEASDSNDVSNIQEATIITSIKMPENKEFENPNTQKKDNPDISKQPSKTTNQSPLF